MRTKPVKHSLPKTEVTCTDNIQSHEIRRMTAVCCLCTTLPSLLSCACMAGCQPFFSDTSVAACSPKKPNFLEMWEGHTEGHAMGQTRGHIRGACEGIWEGQIGGTHGKGTRKGQMGGANGKGKDRGTRTGHIEWAHGSSRHKATRGGTCAAALTSKLWVT